MFDIPVKPVSDSQRRCRRPDRDLLVKDRSKRQTKREGERHRWRLLAHQRRRGIATLFSIMMHKYTQMCTVTIQAKEAARGQEEDKSEEADIQ